MRLHSSMKLEEIRDALNSAAVEAWSPGRSDALKGAIDATAQAIHTVLQVPLELTSEEIDSPVQPGNER